MQHKPFYTTRLFYGSIITLSVIALVLAFQVVVIRITNDTSILLNKDDAPSSRWSIDTTQYDILKAKFSLPDVAPRETAVTGNITTSIEDTSTSTIPGTTVDDTIIDAPMQSEIFTDIQELVIVIKNGTSIDGLAGIVKKSLDDAGFSSVTATNTKYPQTINILYVRDTISDTQIERLRTFLPSSFASVAREQAIDEASYDIEIIIGTPLE